MALAKPSIFTRDRPLLSPLVRSEQTELMDEPGLDTNELAGNLRDIRRVNRLLGGTSIVLRLMPSLIGEWTPSEPLTLLDLATGSADIPVAIARWAETRGMPLRIVASDYSDEMLADAKREVAGIPTIELARYDARSVPLPDGSFDIVVCSLSLHHFAPDEAVLVLREMKRLARRGFILNDLCRSRLGYAAARLAAITTTRNRLTRHDAPLSVLRAYTPDELRNLLERAGAGDATITTHPWFRMAAVWKATSHD
jgi:SAM-dependent methyltransferase